MNNFSSHISNSIYYNIDFFVKNIIGFIFLLLLAREISVDNFGLYNLILSTLFTFINIGRYGYDVTIQKKILKTDNKLIKIEKEIFFLFLFNSFFSCFSFFIYLNYFKTYNFDSELIPILFAIIPIINIFSIYEYIKLATLSYKKIIFFKVLNISIFFCIKILIIFLQIRIEYLFFIIFLEFLILNIFYFKKIINKIFYRIDASFKYFFNTLKSNFPFFIIFISNYLLLKQDIFFSYYYFSPYDTGILSSVSKLSDAANLIFYGISFSLYPLFIKKNINLLKIFLLILVISLLLLILCLFANMFSVEIITIFFGDKFINASELFSVTLFFIPFFFYINFINRILIAKDKQLIVSNIYVLMLIINTILNLILPTYFGLIGLVYSTLISLLIIFFVISFYLLGVTFEKKFLIRNN